MRVAHTFNETAPFHAVQSSDSRWLHHADALAEFALGQSVFIPQRTKKEPLPHAYAVGCDLRLEGARERAMDVANHITNAVVGWGNGLSNRFLGRIENFTSNI